MYCDSLMPRPTLDVAGAQEAHALYVQLLQTYKFMNQNEETVE